MIDQDLSKGLDGSTNLGLLMALGRGNMERLRIAFIKFAGLSSGGTERWLQMMAANLPRDRFEIDYYYCDAAPYVGSDYRHADTDPARVDYMREHGVNLIKFSVGAKDITTPTHDWLDTDFWEVFDPSKYDLVQTAKAGPAEYPFFKLPLPVVEYITLSAGVDSSPNIACSIHLSQWQRARWFRAGGNLAKSTMIPIPAEPPSTSENLRDELGIPADAVVAGFHQRADECIASPIPLQAFQRIGQPDYHFVLMGGGEAYRRQAAELGLRNAHFLPHDGGAERISQFLNTLDIFAHGRKDGETFGTVLAEAMMHGKPCLSHRSDIANAQPETMGPGGLFAEDANDYAEKLRRLATDRELRERLAAKGREHAREHYSLEACVARLGDVYTAHFSGKPLSDPSGTSTYTAYGMTDMGFLYAGDLSHPANIAHCVMGGGVPEEFCVEVMRHFLPDTKVLFDIGANTGLYCWIAAQEGREDINIQTFEPQPDLCTIMKKTVFLNNWEGTVSVHAMVLGAKPDTLELHLCGTSSSLDNSFNDNADLPTRMVPVDTLDHQVATLGIERTDFIKIDVEGFEQMVLEGGRQTLGRDRPILFIKIADQIKGRQYRNKNYRRTLQYLENFGYVILRVNESTDTLERIAPDRDQGHDHIAMYLCVHRDIWPIHESALLARTEAYRRRKAMVNGLPPGLSRLLYRTRAGGALIAVVRHILPEKSRSRLLAGAGKFLH